MRMQRLIAILVFGLGLALALWLSLRGTQTVAAELQRSAVQVIASTDGQHIAGGSIGNRFVIRNTTSMTEVNPAVAYNSQSQEYLVVWQAEAPDPIKEVWGQRVSRNGALLGSAFRISPANGGYSPDVTYNNTANEYLVVWETSTDIRGQRLSATGNLSGAEILIATGYVHGAFHYSQPSVGYASTADRYLVAFRYIWDLDNSSDIQARAYLSDGTPEDYAFEISPAITTTFPEQPDLVYNRSRNEFLVVWQEIYATNNHDIYARRVKMTGGAGVQGSPFSIATSSNDDMTPAVAAVPTLPDQGQYLVAWESSGDIRYKTVTGSGVPGALKILANTAWGEYRPAVAGCESNQQFLAVWTWVPVSTPPAMMQVQGRALALDSTLLDKTTTVGGGQVYNAAVAAGPDGDFLIAFDDNEVFSISNRGIYGWLWGNRAYVPLILRN